MSRNRKYFPLFVNIEEKEIVVVGGGTIASRRIRTLLPFCSHLTVVAPEASEMIRELAAEGRLVWKQEKYTRDSLRYADMVLACTDDPKVNSEIYSVCKCLGIQVNVCSDRRKCDFYFPGVASRGSVVVGVTAGGTDHRKARQIREKIEKLLEEEDHE